MFTVSDFAVRRNCCDTIQNSTGDLNEKEEKWTKREQKKEKEEKH